MPQKERVWYGVVGWSLHSLDSFSLKIGVNEGLKEARKGLEGVQADY